MKVLLFLTVALAILAVVLSTDDKNEEHHKKKGDRKHHEKKHHGERNHGHGKSHRSHGEHERNHEQKGHRSDRHTPIITKLSCSVRQMLVCDGYNCPILTCANYDEEVANWAKCLFETKNSFSNLSFCASSYIDRTSKCICRFGLVLEESSGKCIPKSECDGRATTIPSTTLPSRTPPATLTTPQTPDTTIPV